MNKTNEYIPGVCNIGRAEIGRRKQAGWVGTIVTIAVWLVLFALRVPAAWQLLLFLPASLAASGFLQAFMHFCAGFGSRGLFNFGPEVGKTETVTQAEFRAKDRKKARQIFGLSLIIGVAVAVVAYIVQPK
ncbi:MAG: hypothetical protein WBM07_01330 [Chitinivibrionales bacterium]